MITTGLNTDVKSIKTDIGDFDPKYKHEKKMKKIKERKNSTCWLIVGLLLLNHGFLLPFVFKVLP